MAGTFTNTNAPTGGTFTPSITPVAFPTTGPPATDPSNVVNKAASSSSSNSSNNSGGGTTSGGGGTTTSDTSGSSTSSNPYANPAAVALYNLLASEYQGEASTLEGEAPTLEGNINNAYDTSVSEENQNEGNEVNQNQEQRQSTLGTIDQNANTTYNALMALLGSHGAAGSSSATFGVPQAVGANTDSATNNASSTYAQNNNTIQETYQNALQELLSQKNTNLANALSGLNEQEEGDIQNAESAKVNAAEYGNEGAATAVANTAPLQAQANNIQDQLGQIFAQYATPTYTAPAAPTLASYDAGTPATITQASASTPTSSSAFLPYLTNQAQPNILTGSNTTPAPAGTVA